MGEEERNKATFLRFFEAVGRGDLDVVDVVFAEDVTYVLPGSQPLHGRDAVRALVAGFRDAFPDLSVGVEAMAAEGEYVAARVIPRGTNTGDFMGFGSSGRSASWPASHFARFRHGQVVEDHVVFDQLDLLGQLGFVPAASPSE
jgi:steroid delta-isomerase-like uncharacterized protein